MNNGNWTYKLATEIVKLTRKKKEFKHTSCDQSHVR